MIYKKFGVSFSAIFHYFPLVSVRSCGLCDLEMGKYWAYGNDAAKRIQRSDGRRREVGELQAAQGGFASWRHEAM